MAAFLIPLFIVLGVFAFTAADDIVQNISLPLPRLQFFPESKDKTLPDPVPTGSIEQAPSVPSASFQLDTIITQGPGQGAVISNTRQVRFDFQGSVAPADTGGKITYQTRVPGVDKDWVSTSRTFRAVTLPAGASDVSFEVRSKLGTVLDQTPAQRSFRLEISPYFGLVNMTFKRASGSAPFLVTLNPRMPSGQTAVITDWTLSSNTGTFRIGTATKQVRSFNNSFSEPIVVQRGERVLITGAASPFGAGGSYKPNVCMGWLEEFFNFPLSVPSSCPDRIRVEDVSFLGVSCQDFLLKDATPSRCQVPNYSENTAVAGDSQCVSFINNNLTYDSCVKKHSDDANFLKNEWHVYADRSFGHPSRDTIRLLDAQGLLVDEIIY